MTTLLSALTTISALVDRQTQLVSVNVAGTGSGNNLSRDPAISADGRFVAFASGATDLVTKTDINGSLSDVFRHDRETGETTLVSVNVAGTGSGNNLSRDPTISADGRLVAFLSSASDLDPLTPDTNTGPDVYVRDLDTNVTTLVSVNHSGNGSGNGGCSNPVISANGRFVAFVSLATDLVADKNDANGALDVFVRDGDTGVTTLVSENSAGVGSGNAHSFNPVISADGLVVAFTGHATNLVAGVIDIDGKSSVFVREWQTGATALVSINTAGTANGSSFDPAISADGRFVAFRSDATDLVAGATDANNTMDIFVREWKNGVTKLVSATAHSDGMASGNGISGSAAEPGIAKSVISADGRFVAFVSLATDLVADKNDANGALDVFVRDGDTGVTTLVSENSAGVGSGNFQSDSPVMSREGRFVAFRSSASDLVTNDTSGADVFVRDRQTVQTKLVSVNSAGTSGGNNQSSNPVISSDGRFVAFHSSATNLVALTDTNQTIDVLVREVSAPGRLQFDATTYSASEDGGSATITVSRTGGSDGTVTVSYAASDATATAGSDYTAASDTITWGDGDAASKTFTILITNDTVDESDETVILALSNPAGGASLGTPSTAVLTIVDEDPPNGELRFDAPNYSVSEGGVSATITVTRTGGSGGTVTVSYVASDVTATAGSDYTAASDTLTWGDGETANKSFTILIANDTLDESDETLNLALSNPTGGASLGTPSTAVLTIVDEDPPNGELRFELSTYSASEGDVSANITVTRTGGSGGTVTVSYATSNATAVGSDYGPASGVLTWLDGDAATKAFAIPITSDTLDESDETVNLALSNPTGGASLGNPGTAVLTIVDDDPPPSVSINDITMTEGNLNFPMMPRNAVFTVSLSAASGQTVTVQFATANGTAMAPSDYGEKSGTVTFSPGQQSRTIAVTIRGDFQLEPNETFFVNLSNAVAATIAKAQGVGTIINDEVGLTYANPIK